MDTQKIKSLHKIAGTLALLIILAFFSFSLYAEFKDDHHLIKMVKTGILYGVALLFLIMPATGITGRKLAGQGTSPIIGIKMKRMKLIVANAFILISLAITLYYRAVNGMIDQTFMVIQVVELAFGLTNAVFLALMIRDGRLLAANLKTKKENR